MNRRDWIGIVAVIGLSKLLPSRAGAGTYVVPPDHAEIAHWLQTTVMQHFRSAEEVGRVVVQGRLCDTNLRKLTKKFANVIGSQCNELPAKETNCAVLKAINAEIASDFENGWIVYVDGWIFSLTEAETCALCYLARPRENSDQTMFFDAPNTRLRSTRWE